MKSFQQFIKEISTISYPGTPKHKVYNKNRITNVGAGRAVPRKSPSSSGGNGNGNGDGGDGGNGD